MTFKFKNEFLLEKRIEESSKILAKHSGRKPVIVEIDNTSFFKKGVPDTLVKNKYLVPDDFTISKFMYVIRQNIKLDPSVGLFMLVNGNTLPPQNVLFNQLYDDYKDEDGFLYMKVTGEHVFG